MIAQGQQICDNTTVHIQKTDSNIGYLPNRGNGGYIAASNISFDQTNLLFGQGAIKLSQQSSFIVLSYVDGIFAQNEDFLIDFWFYKDQNVAEKHEAVIANDYASRNSGNFTANWRLLYNHTSGEGFKFIHDQGNQVLNSGPVILGQWNYLAIERHNGDLYMYLNGALVSTESNVTKAMNPFGLLGSEAQAALGYATIEEFNQNFPNSCFEIGAVPTLGSSYVGFDGQIQDFRIVKGESGYNGSSFSLESDQDQSSFLHIKSTGVARDTSTDNDCRPIDNGQSAVFNGSSSFIDTGNNFTPNLMSFSCWAKPSYSTTIDTIFGARLSTSGGYKGIQFGVHSGKIYNRFDNGAGNRGSANSATEDIATDGSWTHLAFTVDVNNGEAKVYANGSLLYTESISGSIEANLNQAIGRLNGPDAGSYWSGGLDDIRIYSDVLTSTEVNYIAKNETSNIPTDNLVSYYKLDGSAQDSAGSNDGTATAITYGDAAEVCTSGCGPIDNGQSAVFNGSSSAIIPPAFGNTYPFTYSVWINPNSVGPTSIITDAISGNRVLFGTQSSSFSRTNYFVVGQEGQAHFGTASNTVNSNTWSHIVLVATSVNNYTLYINGVLQTLTNLGGAVGGTALYAIGSNGTDGQGVHGGEYFDGRIDDLRIYSNILTPEEVNYLAKNDTSNIPSDNLSTHYKLDGNAQDSAGSNNGTETAVTYGEAAEVCTPEQSSNMTSSIGLQISGDGERLTSQSNPSTNDSYEYGYFENLPAYLTEIPSTIHANSGDFTITLSGSTKIYLVEDDAWTKVSKTGWTQISDSNDITLTVTDFPGYAGTVWSSIKVWEKVLPAGTHTLSNVSAYYFFESSIARISSTIDLQVADNGVEYTVNNNEPFGSFADLPLQLIGLQSTVNCNDGNIEVNLSKPTKTYLLYAYGWSQQGMLGSKTGWSKVIDSTGIEFTSSSTSVTRWFLYEKILTAGKHTLNNYSAYYFFETEGALANNEIIDVSSNQYNLEISKDFHSSTGFRSVYPSADTPTLPSQCDFTRYDVGEYAIADLPTTLHGNSKTVTLQYRSQESVNHNYLISLGDSTHQAWMRVYNGKFSFEIGDPGEWAIYLRTEITPELNKWHDITFTYGSNRDEASVSIDGVYFDYNNSNTSGSQNNTMAEINGGKFAINSSRSGNNSANADYKNIKIFEGQATDISNIDPASTSVPAGCSSLAFDSAKGDGSDNNLEFAITGNPGCPGVPIAGSSITHHGGSGNNITVGSRGNFLGSSHAFEFDGNGDVLTVDIESDASLDGDFTISFWAKRHDNSLASSWNQRMFTIGHSSSLSQIGGYLGVFTTSSLIGVDPVSTSSGAISIIKGSIVSSNQTRASVSTPLNEWYHIALVRSGVNNKLYLDGECIIEYEEATISSIPGPLHVGSVVHTSGSFYGLFDGLIQDFRITETVDYVTNFTPPTSLTSPTSAKLLLQADKYWSDFTTNNGIGVNGGTIDNIFTNNDNPLTKNWYRLAGSTTGTLEFSIPIKSTDTVEFGYFNDASSIILKSAGNVDLETTEKAGGTIAEGGKYNQDVSSHFTSAVSKFTLESDFNWEFGYIKINGKILSNFEDLSSNSYNVTALGDTKVIELAGSEGSSSGDFKFLYDGSSSYTFEMWIKPEEMTHTEVIVHTGNGFNDGVKWNLTTDGGIRFRIYSAISGKTWRTFRSAAGLIQKNQWHHIAVTLDDNNVLTMYVDGAVPNKVADSLESSDTLTTADKGELTFGGGGSNSYRGQLQDIKITKGVVYIEEFTPAFPLPLAAGTLTKETDEGTYTGDGNVSNGYAVNLGYRPIEVTVTAILNCTYCGTMTIRDGDPIVGSKRYFDGSQSVNYPTGEYVITQNDFDTKTGHIEITDTGFIAYGWQNDSVFNLATQNYTYVATKSESINSVGGGSSLLDLCYLEQTIQFNFDQNVKVSDLLQLNPTSSSGLPVVYSVDDGSVASINGNTLTILSEGSTTVTASQAGNSEYYPAYSQLTIQATKYNQTITFSLQDVGEIGDEITLNGTSDSGLTVLYVSSDTSIATISSNILTIVGSGTVNITAYQNGNNTFEPAQQVIQTLSSKQTQVITFSLQAIADVGDQIALSATSDSGLPVSYSTSDTSIATINESNLTVVGSGSVTITASQSGDSNYSAAIAVQQSLSVNKLNQSISFSLQDTAAVGNAITLNGSSDSGLSVSYTSSDANVATISGSTLTVVGSGSVTITAFQPGNETYNAADSVQQFLSTSKQSQSIVFSLPNSLGKGDTITLNGASSSGLPVSYVSSNPSVVSISGGVATIISEGSATITASQSGDNQYAAAEEVTESIFISNPTFDGLKNASMVYASMLENMEPRWDEIYGNLAITGALAGFNTIINHCIENDLIQNINNALSLDLGDITLDYLGDNFTINYRPDDTGIIQTGGYNYTGMNFKVVSDTSNNDLFNQSIYFNIDESRQNPVRMFMIDSGDYNVYQIREVDPS